MSQHCCTDCDGLGLTKDDDWDDDGRRTVMVQCQSCLGLGHLVDCRDCDECTPVPELELNGGRCNRCAAEHEMIDAHSERERVRRIA